MEYIGGRRTKFRMFGNHDLEVNIGSIIVQVPVAYFRSQFG